MIVKNKKIFIIIGCVIRLDYLRAKYFLETEGIILSKKSTIKILMRQFKFEENEAISIYNSWRRNWCNCNEEKIKNY